MSAFLKPKKRCISHLVKPHQQFKCLEKNKESLGRRGPMEGRPDGERRKGVFHPGTADDLGGLSENVSNVTEGKGNSMKDPGPEESQCEELEEANAHQIRAHMKILQEATPEQVALIEKLCVFEERLRQRNDRLMKAYDAMKAEHLYYIDLFELAPDGYLVTDGSGYIREANGTALKLLRVDREWLTGKPVSTFVPDQDKDAFDTRLKELSTASEAETWEVRIQPRNGPVFTAELSVIRVPSEEKDTRDLRWSIRDISERKHAEEDLRHHTANLEMTNRELEEFASIASHDLQEPLRKIQMYSDLLGRRYANELKDEAREYFKKMQNAAARMSTLIDALLRYSRVGKRTTHFSQIDLTTLAREAASDLEAFVNRKRGTVAIEGLPEAEVDAPQVRQLFQNLIANALKFNDSDTPRVRIYGEEQDGTCRIYVEDNGIGFDEQYVNKIFAPFERLHGKNSRYKGQGLGLSICRKIVERHGGSITAKSKPGEGATFVVTIPARKHQEAVSKGDG